MTALTADRNTVSKEIKLKSYPVAASEVIYKGGMVVINASGYLAMASDTSGVSRVVGVADEQVDNSSGSNGDKSARVVSGRAFKFAASSITQGMLGTTMYVVDDNTFDDAAGATNEIMAGVLVEFVSTTEGWIYIAGPGDVPDLSVGEADIQDGAVAGDKLKDEALQLYSVAGQDETMDTTYPVTGVAVGDKVMGVLFLSTEASVATIAVLTSTDYTVTGADEITAGGTPVDRSNDQLIFLIAKA